VFENSAPMILLFPSYESSICQTEMETGRVTRRDGRDEKKQVGGERNKQNASGSSVGPVLIYPLT